MKVKKKRIKRVFAFLLTVVLVFTTCLTVSPYTVQATENGQTEGDEEGAEEKPEEKPEQIEDDTAKLSVKVINNEVVNSGPGLSGINLILIYNGSSKKTLAIGENQMGSAVGTDISYAEFAGAAYKVTASDINDLYNIEAKTSLDAKNKILTVTITSITVKTNGNRIITENETIYAEETNTFAVTGTWATYINSWEIVDNTAEAQIVGAANANTCAIKAANGVNASFTVVAKNGEMEIARKLVKVNRKETQIQVTSSAQQSWFEKEVTFTFTLTSNSGPIAGKQVTYQYTEKSGEQVQGACSKLTDINGQTTVEVTLDGFWEEFSITGIFAGDAVYRESSNVGKYYPNKENANIQFDSEYTTAKPLKMVYGTKDIELTFGLKHGTKEIEENLSSLNCKVEPSENISITPNMQDKKITITPKKVSSQNIEVIITGETESYTFSKVIYVKVEPYPLVIDEESVKVSAPGKSDFLNEKIYDATSIVDVKATLKEVKDMEPTETALEEIGKFTDAVFKNYDSKLIDVLGDEQEQKMTFAPKDLSTVEFADISLTEEEKINLKNNYKIQDEQKSIEVLLTIQRRELKLTVGNTSRGFRDLKYTTGLDQLISVNATDADTGFVDGQNEITLEKSGFKFPNVVDITAINLTEDNVKSNDTAKYGEHPGALQIEEEQMEGVHESNPTNNYKFDLSDYTKGTLSITEEENVSGYVTVNSSSVHAYEDKQDGVPVRYYGDQAVIRFTLTGDYNKIYSCDEDGTNSVDVMQSGLSLLEEKADITRTFYLTKESASGELIEKTEVFQISFKYDADAPDCEEIKFGNAGRVVTDLAQAITFGIYRNHQIEARVKVQDALSGISGVFYYVTTTDEDKQYEDYTDELVKAEFQDAGMPEEDHTWTIKNIGKLGKDETLESNNYIVFVKTKDNVGNVKIYGSNGVVLENMHDISVTYTESAEEEVYGNIWNGITYYSGSAQLHLKAEENASESKYYSGLKDMGYVVSYEYGDETTKTEKRVVVKNNYPENVSLSELKTYCTITKDLAFADDSKKSQIITVTANAEDNAGNGMDADAKHTIVLDSIAPTVTSVCEQENNNKQFLHKKYANSNVTYDVTVQERFLKDLSIQINGKDYTLAQLEEQKTALGIGTVKKDEVVDLTQEKTTDETKYHFTLIFTKDGDYTVKTTATDGAINTGSDAGFTFVIDTVAPELKVTYTAYNKKQTTSRLSTTSGRVYANEAVEYITATAVMIERNFSSADVIAKVRAVNSKNANVDIADYGASIQEQWTDLGEVSGSDNRHKYTMTLPVIHVDANYNFTYNYIDLAGNPLKATVKHAITLDRVKPKGTVTVENLVNGSAKQVWKKLLSTITFGYFGKNRVQASVKGEDETAGVASTQYLVSAKALTRKNLEKRTDWTKYSSRISLAANQHLVVYEKVKDKAGNIEFFSSDGIIVDNTNPVPTIKITPTAPAWGKGVYKAADNPGFDIYVKEPEVNDTYAGLKTITYQIVNGTTGYTESGTLASLSKKAHQSVWTGHVTINPNQFYSNDVKVRVYAEDWSTNGANSGTSTLKIDNKAPIVKFSFDKGDVQNGKYYKNDKVLTITVDERNFDESYLPKVTSTTGSGYSIGKWRHNGELHTATVTFSGDSDYTVSYDCYDLAGNKSNTEKLEEFTVDKTAPVIKVSYDNNSALHDRYYKAARTATITVTEHNFDASKITVSTTASAGQAPGTGGWSNNGDTHTTSVVFDHDADYTFAVSGFDLAENKAADYPQDKFTVDLKNPEIKITGVKDKSANNGTVAPQVRISDTNFIASGAKITLKGVNRGKVEIDSLATITSDETGMDAVFEDFPAGMDDIYTLNAKSVDKAGNETSSSITFSVNRDGSTYELSKSTKALVEKKYINQPQNLEITEINVDDLTAIEITYSLDGKVVTLKEGTDYTSEKSGKEGQWKKYVYEIKSTCFEKEGTYVINIYSEDAAHNSTTNKSKAKTIEFTVDQTAPTMVVSNLVDKGRYKENAHEFALNVKDNIFMFYVEVYLDGKLFKHFEEDEIEQLSGELLLDISSSNQYQTIRLVSCDKAGNISKEVYNPETNTHVSASYKVLVTQNRLVQFINNKPLLIGVIAALIVAAGMMIVLVKRRRKNEE